MPIGYANMGGRALLNSLSQNQKIKSQKRDWYHRNKEKVLEQQKSSESKMRSQREWYQNNKELCIDRARKWTENNPTARKLIVQRYTLKKSSIGRWSNDSD